MSEIIGYEIVKISALYDVRITREDIAKCKDPCMTDSQKITMLAKRKVINRELVPDFVGIKSDMKLYTFS